MKHSILVIGAGISGASVARALAENGTHVLVVDKRPHTAGCTYDYADAHGIMIHKYGPHIFHTNNGMVWDFLSRFTAWHHYQHTVLGWIQGRLVPLPINIDTIQALYNQPMTASLMKQFLDERRVAIDAPASMREAVVSQIGEELYSLVFENYTKKQWGMDPENLPASIAARVPTRFNRDPRYFTDRYQGIPRDGYTALIERMLDHPAITVRLGVDAGDVGAYAGGDWNTRHDKLIYTGGIDDFHSHSFGRLPYRSLRFVLETHACEQYQPVAVVNYPNDYDFTRITEFKHFTGKKCSGTTIMYEYPQAEGEPYYPIPIPSATELYNKYKADADKLENVFFLGRMGQYKYINMDQAVHLACELAADILGKNVDALFER